MDPVETLRQMCDLARRIHAAQEEALDPGTRPWDRERLLDEAADLGGELAAHVLALDAWRTSGGFDPWEKRS